MVIPGSCAIGVQYWCLRAHVNAYTVLGSGCSAHKNATLSHSIHHPSRQGTPVIICLLGCTFHVSDLPESKGVK